LLSGKLIFVFGGIVMREYFLDKKSSRLFIAEYDEYPIDPRENDNLGRMLCFHKRYELGDDLDLDIYLEDFKSWDEVEEWIWKNEDPLVVYPLSLLDHSGTKIWIGEPTCPWDSGRVGFIYARKSDIKKWFDVDEITEDIENKVKEILEEEVKEYDCWMNGEVYRVKVYDVSNVKNINKFVKKLEMKVIDLVDDDFDVNELINNVTSMNMIEEAVSLWHEDYSVEKAIKKWFNVDDLELIS